jgi:SAM-dependent methyltransferase
LAERLGVSVQGLERIVVVLHSLGLVVRTGGVYRNHALASQLLTEKAPGNMRSFLLQQQRQMYPLFAHLTDAVRTGRAQTWRWSFGTSPDEDCYQALLRTPDELRVFLEAMNTAATGVGTAIARQVDFGRIHTLLDLGGGGGQIAVELAQAVPHLHVIIVDHPEACAFADRHVALHTLTDRVRTQHGDFLGSLPSELGGADAVLLGGILADWDVAQRARILANARRSLARNGTLLVSETLLDDTNDGPLLPAMLSLMMLVGMRGKNFTPNEIKTMLTAAGFGQTSVFLNRSLGVRDLVVATKEGD